MARTIPKCLMHVDDDPLMTRIVSQRLTAAGYEVISLNDPRQALGKLLETNCRLVLLDIDMPHRNGLDLLTEIKRQDGGVQVIMLTGMVSMTTVLQSMRKGAEACFFKPLRDVEPLLEAIDAGFAKIERWWKALEWRRALSSNGGLVATEPLNVSYHQETEPVE